MVAVRWGTWMTLEPTEGTRSGSDTQRRQRARSLAIALTLGALVLLFYFVTIVKMGPAILHRPM